MNGEPRDGEGWDEERSPIDRDILIGTFARATRQDAKDAIAAAEEAFPDWSGMSWFGMSWFGTPDSTSDYGMSWFGGAWYGCWDQ